MISWWMRAHLVVSSSPISSASFTPNAWSAASSECSKGSRKKPASALSTWRWKPASTAAQAMARAFGSVAQEWAEPR